LATGTEKRLFSLSSESFSLAADLVQRGSLEEGEKCYLLSLELEAFLYLYHTADKARMARRKLHYACFLIGFYREHNRMSEAIAVLQEHLLFGSEALRKYGSESSLHRHMSNLLQTGLELFDEREKTDRYREITEHLIKRIEALKDAYFDYTDVAGKDVWQYLYYFYDDDYENLVRYHLMLDNRADAISVLEQSSSLDSQEREQLNYGSVDWERIAEKKEFASIREELTGLVSRNG